MFIPITQSKMWQKLQDDLGEKSSLEAGNGYQYLAIQKSTPVGNYLYLPYGPVVEDVAGFRNSFKSLKNLAAKTDSIFIRIEPLNAELANNFPSNTIKVKDLNPKET